MFIDDTGIVLKTVRYDDASSVAHIFTRTHGTESFMVTRPKSRTSAGASPAALLAPLNVLSFLWNRKPTASLYRLRDAHAAIVWRTIPYHPVKRAIALMLGEFLAAMLREESENTTLFDYIADSLCWLDDADEGFANFHLVFLLNIARFLGISPDSDTFAEGSYFDLESALFVPWATASPLVLTPPDALLLWHLSQTDYPAMSAIRMARTDRSRLLTYLNRFFLIHLPAFPQLNSLDVLEDLFQ